MPNANRPKVGYEGLVLPQPPRTPYGNDTYARPMPERGVVDKRSREGGAEALGQAAGNIRKWIERVDTESVRDAYARGGSAAVSKEMVSGAFGRTKTAMSLAGDLVGENLPAYLHSRWQESLSDGAFPALTVDVDAQAEQWTQEFFADKNEDPVFLAAARRSAAAGVREFVRQTKEFQHVSTVEANTQLVLDKMVKDSWTLLRQVNNTSSFDADDTVSFDPAAMTAVAKHYTDTFFTLVSQGELSPVAAKRLLQQAMTEIVEADPTTYEAVIQISRQVDTTVGGTKGRSTLFSREWANDLQRVGLASINAADAIEERESRRELRRQEKDYRDISRQLSLLSLEAQRAGKPIREFAPDRVAELEDRLVKGHGVDRMAQFNDYIDKADQHLGETQATEERGEVVLLPVSQARRKLYDGSLSEDEAWNLVEQYKQRGQTERASAIAQAAQQAYGANESFNPKRIIPDLEDRVTNDIVRRRTTDIGIQLETAGDPNATSRFFMNGVAASLSEEAKLATSDWLATLGHTPSPEEEKQFSSELDDRLKSFGDGMFGQASQEVKFRAAEATAVAEETASPSVAEQARTGETNTEAPSPAPTLSDPDVSRAYSAMSAEGVSSALAAANATLAGIDLSWASVYSSGPVLTLDDAKALAARLDSEKQWAEASLRSVREHPLNSPNTPYRERYIGAQSTLVAKRQTERYERIEANYKRWMSDLVAYSAATRNIQFVTETYAWVSEGKAITPQTAIQAAQSPAGRKALFFSTGLPRVPMCGGPQMFSLMQQEYEQAKDKTATALGRMFSAFELADEGKRRAFLKYHNDLYGVSTPEDQTMKPNQE